MTVEIIEYSTAFPLRTLGPDLNSREGKARIKSQVDHAMHSSIRGNQPNPSNLQQLIDFFGEQVSVDPVQDLNRYFHVTGAGGFPVTTGGIPTYVPPWGIGPSHVRPSNTAISVIGEGLAGWYLTRKQMGPLARPIGEAVDLIFRDTAGFSPSYTLVQVKSTQQEDVRPQMKSDVLKLLQFRTNLAPLVNPSRLLSCYMIGIVIYPASGFRFHCLEMSSTWGFQP